MPCTLDLSLPPFSGCQRFVQEFLAALIVIYVIVRVVTCTHTKSHATLWTEKKRNNILPEARAVYYVTVCHGTPNGIRDGISLQR
jgi:hypothetical protein